MTKPNDVNAAPMQCIVPRPYFEKDGVAIYHGDCRQILPQLGKFDLLLTDPPYGIGDKWNGGNWKTGCGKARLWKGEGEAVWDVRENVSWLLGYAEKAIVWGGNYFTELGPQAGWLVWDKDANMLQAQAELAWTNCVVNVRCFRLSPLGVFGNHGKNGEYKMHPTQKPQALMKWCLGLVKAETVIDPFMGSGSTVVAARDEGRKAVGIEISEEYCEVAAKRLSQGVLF